MQAIYVIIDSEIFHPLTYFDAHFVLTESGLIVPGHGDDKTDVVRENMQYVIYYLVLFPLYFD